MHIRLSRFAGLPPERIHEMIDEFERGDYVSGLERSEGFRGFLVGVDRQAGKVTAMSLWETAKDLQASDREAERAREARIEQAQPERNPIIDRYEVVFERRV